MAIVYSKYLIWVTMGDMEKVCIIVNGPTCAGKSTLIVELGKLRPNLFHVSYDRIKRCFLGYAPGTHREDIYAMLKVLVQEAMNRGFSMVKDGGLYKEKVREMTDLLETNGYRLIEVNIEAPDDILLLRFRDRVNGALSGGEQPMNLSEERFWELNKMYKEVKDPSLKTYDTSKMTSEAIAKEILTLL